MNGNEENQKDEALLDAEQWERSDEQALFDACVAFVNAGIKAAGSDGIVRLEGNEIVVVSWSGRGKLWKATRREVLNRARMLRASRKNRKLVSERLLRGLPPYDQAKQLQ